MRKIGSYLAVAGLIGYFGACTSEKRDFGADGNMAAAGQANTGGRPASIVGGGGGAAGAGMLMVVKVPCKSRAECDDKNPCNGLEICSGEKFCAAEGMNVADGSVCLAPAGTMPVATTTPGNAGGAGGAGGAAGPTVMSPSNQFFCTKGSCARGYCGDSYTDKVAGEECDDGNTNEDDGCRKDCQFTCEATPECDDKIFCNGAEICIPATHTCATGAKPLDKDICDAPLSTKECRQGACVNIGCGNGTVEPSKGEECDDGNVTAADGCELDCRWTCKSDTDCSDKDACNGTETCDLTAHLCKAGVAVPVVNDGNPCTDDLCNPADGTPSHPLKDADYDGEASTMLGACGTDCDDADLTMFSKNQEICGDGKDNDCNPATGDLDASTRYYLDCDGDGYATDPQNNYVSSCGVPPPPKAGLCKEGSANQWTTTVPDPKGPRNWDCSDADVRVNPQQTQYFPDSYPSPISGAPSWDYDCDRIETHADMSAGVPKNSLCDGQYQCAEGFADAVNPSCGSYGTYTYCSSGLIYYTAIPAVRTAATSGSIIIRPLPLYCPSNTYRDSYNKQQSCR